MRQFDRFYFCLHLAALAAFNCVCLLLLTGCAPEAQLGLPAPTSSPALRLSVTVDGAVREISTSAMTIGAAIEEAGIVVDPADEVDPPLTTSLRQPQLPVPLEVTVVRVTETSEVIPESIAYDRRIVRSADMSPDDPPRLLQIGVPGYQEVTVRIVFRDGLEAERWPTAITVIEPPVDEIIMLGVSSGRDELPISGRLAYIDDGRAIVLAGSTDSPRQLSIDGSLDGRVFQLSPDGQYLLFTLEATDSPQDSFANELWVIATAEGATAQSLQIENVLWAAWDPAALESPRIAYTTARSVSLPPGWEAINDLWLLTLPIDGAQPAPIRLIETYPAAFGWWGGAYAWSPDGGRLAYAFADEIGLLEIPPPEALLAVDDLAPAEPARTSIHTFVAYDTGADWAWLPDISWSADGRYLAFTDHAGDADRFDLWLADTIASNNAILAEGTGIWSATQWSPPTTLPDSRLAYLRAIDPEESAESSYVLWLTDADGSNARRIYPPEGETGRFARTSQSLAWGPDENAIAFIFDDALHIVDLSTGDLYRAASDDTVSSHPSWAPYGSAAGR